MAFNAELRRGERSPWDVTTTDTFMGSILSRFGLMAPSSRTAGTLLTGLGGMAGRSVASLLPTRMAHAADDAAFLENIGDCPRLEEIGAVGNRICQPFVVSDSSTTPIDAYDLYRIMAWMHGEPDPENLSCRNAAGYGAPNFLCRMAEASEEEFLYVTERRTEPVTGAEFYDTRAFRADDGKYYITELIPDRAGGLEQIGRGSRLGDYVTFCSNRSTFWGEVDNNILAMQGGTGRRVLSTTGVALNWVPVVSDITSLASSAQDLALLDAGWATGQNCVVGDGTFTTAEGTTRDFHGTGTLGWSRETRFLSQYLEDQRIFEGAGMISSSPSIAFIEEHDPWGWANDSYESFLAMISGLTPTEVAATMDMIDWVARMMDPDYVAALGPFTRDVRSASEQLPEVEDWREEVSRSVQEAATKIGSAFHWAAKRQWGTT
ncbi:hypothetical protein FWH13_02895 [Candidatus Saccharibacteria bacterium]|nr:hypothetical protein [Candidatus Saccharibacteria bacterium]